MTLKKGPPEEATAPPSPLVPPKRSKAEHSPGASAPVFTRKMRNAAVGTGCDIRLKVCVSGDPQPSLYWYHNEDLLDMENQEYGGLWIRDCKPTDAGLYTCIANNHQGEARSSAVLAVLDLGEESESEEEDGEELEERADSVMDTAADVDPQHEDHTAIRESPPQTLPPPSPRPSKRLPSSPMPSSPMPSRSTTPIGARKRISVPPGDYQDTVPGEFQDKVKQPKPALTNTCQQETRPQTPLSEQSRKEYTPRPSPKLTRASSKVFEKVRGLEERRRSLDVPEGSVSGRSWAGFNRAGSVDSDDGGSRLGISRESSREDLREALKEDAAERRSMFRQRAASLEDKPRYSQKVQDIENKFTEELQRIKKLVGKTHMKKSFSTEQLTLKAKQRTPLRKIEPIPPQVLQKLQERERAGWDKEKAQRQERDPLSPPESVQLTELPGQRPLRSPITEVAQRSSSPLVQQLEAPRREKRPPSPLVQRVTPRLQDDASGRRTPVEVALRRVEARPESPLVQRRGGADVPPPKPLRTSEDPGWSVPRIVVREEKTVPKEGSREGALKSRKKKTRPMSPEQDSSDDSYVSAGEDPLESPVFEFPLQDTVSVSGADLVLKCIISGTPKPEVTWSKDGGPVSGLGLNYAVKVEGERHSLWIKSVRVCNGGVYCASAKNEIGEASSSATLTVRVFLWITVRLCFGMFVARVPASGRGVMPGMAGDRGLEQLTRRHAVKLVTAASCSVEEAILAVGKEVGYVHIKSASRMNGAVVIFLSSTEKVAEAVEKGATIQGLFTSVLPLVSPARRVIVSNAPPFIKNETLAAELSRFGQLTRSDHRRQVLMVLKDHRRQVLMVLKDHRRQVLMVLKDNSELNLSFTFKVDGFSYRGGRGAIGGPPPAPTPPPADGTAGDPPDNPDTAAGPAVEPAVEPAAGPAVEAPTAVNDPDSTPPPPEEQVCDMSQELSSVGDKNMVSPNSNLNLPLDLSSPITSDEEYLSPLEESVETTADSHRLSPRFKQPPAFVSTMSDQSVVEGREVSFSVRVSGQPKPMLYWLRDRVTVKSGPRHLVSETDDRFEMTILSAARSDTGVYTCKIINEYGSKQCEALLRVTGAAEGHRYEGGCEALLRVTGTREGGEALLRVTGTRGVRGAAVGHRYEGGVRGGVRGAAEGHRYEGGVRGAAEGHRYEGGCKALLRVTGTREGGEALLRVTGTRGGEALLRVTGTRGGVRGAAEGHRYEGGYEGGCEALLRVTFTRGGEALLRVTGTRGGYEVLLRVTGTTGGCEALLRVTGAAEGHRYEGGCEALLRVTGTREGGEALLRVTGTRGVRGAAVGHRYEGGVRGGVRGAAEGHRYEGGCEALLRVTGTREGGEALLRVTGTRGVRGAAVGHRYEGGVRGGVRGAAEGHRYEGGVRGAAEGHRYEGGCKALLRVTGTREGGEALLRVTGTRGGEALLRVTGTRGGVRGAAEGHRYEGGYEGGCEALLRVTFTRGGEALLRVTGTRGGCEVLLRVTGTRGGCEALLRVTGTREGVRGGGEALLRVTGTREGGEALLRVTGTRGGREVLLRVTAPPIEPALAVVRPVRDVAAKAGDTVLLECHVSGPKDTDVDWLSDGRLIQPALLNCKMQVKGRSCRLLLHSVHEDDSGTYTCKISSSREEVTSTGRLSVQPSVEPLFTRKLDVLEVIEGRTARFDCKVSGTPAPKVVWSHFDQPLVENEDVRMVREGGRHSLIISHVTNDDEGFYTVTARNPHGDAESSAELYIQEHRPAISSQMAKLEKMPSIPEEPEVPDSDLERFSMPDFTKALLDLDVVEGREAVLKCRVSGLPYPSISWYHNGLPIRSTEDRKMMQHRDVHSLLIRSVTHSHGGVYKSVIANKVGKATCYAHLYVTG
uniref:Ig-like domain-containing protein n=1 Tax=Knipowitschia caucasica TaxID=637954 RepID=A0AAV2K191_KNICA